MDEASVLSTLGRQAEALALIEQVDPGAYQATTSDPGRGALLSATRARILLRMGRQAEALPQLRSAVQAMQAAGVADEEIAPFRQALADAATPRR